ncbi:MAG TPA: hypothetical protein VNC50_22075, partial [Planctomycetia bacterium]|nr:hypothetical protein [Planctomycetia bacterium]
MQRGREPDRYRPRVEALEPRLAPAVGVRLEVGLLDVQGAGNDDILVRFNAGAQQYEVLDAGVLAATAPADLVQRIRVKSGGGNSILAIDPTVTIRTELVGTAGDDQLIAGSGEAIMDGQGGDDMLVGGPKKLFADGGDGDDNLLADGGPAVLLAGGGDNMLIGGTARDRLYSGPGTNLLVGNGGVNAYFDGSGPTDVVPGIEDLPGFPGLLPPEVLPPSDFDLNSFVSEATESTQILTAAEADQILARAAAASASEDAIIAIVDRTGRILAVRVEAGVDPGLIADPALLSFAIDGAIAKARTGAFFANNAAPLNSRTIQFISQSTKTEREIESNPNILDPDSSLRGPGFVAPIGIGGHFPPVSFTPSANLFDIEHTNRDRLGGITINGDVTGQPGVSGHAGADGIAGTADDPVTGAVGRFNIPFADYAPGKVLEAPISFGQYSGLFPNGQSRGIGTLPGGIPLYKNGQVVGGIGVFFPGKTGYANEENSVLSSDYDATKPDRSLEAEWMAFAAAGGSSGAFAGIGTINGVGSLPGFDLPFGRIDVDGITVPIFGPLVGGVPV